MNYVGTVQSAINNVFRKHGSIAAALYKHPRTGKVLATVADTYIGLEIVTGPGISQGNVKALQAELEDGVGKALGGREIKLRFTNQPFQIQIPRERPIYPELDLTRAPMPYFTAGIGRRYVYTKQQEITLDLTNRNDAHLIVSGMTGSGKSVTLEGMLCTLAYNTPPDLLRVYLIDMKKRSLARFDNIPHVVMSAYNEQDAYLACKAVFDDLIQRRDMDRSQWQNDRTRVVLFIDELRELLFADNNLLKGHNSWLARIVALGGELGVHLIAATQTPSAKELGAIITSNFTVRMAGVLESAQRSYDALKHKGAGAERLVGNGDMLITRVGSDPARLQTYYARDPDRLTTQISARWSGQSNRVEITPEVIQEAMPVDILTAQVEKARAEFMRQYDPDTKAVKRGGKLPIAQAIFGPDVKYAGYWQKQTNRVIDTLLGEVNG